MSFFGIGKEVEDAGKGISNVTAGIRSAFTGEIPPQVLAEMDKLETKAVTERWVADSRIKWWESSRAIVLLFLTLVYTTMMVFDLFGLSLAQHWVDSMTSTMFVVYGAFFGGKTIELAKGIDK